MESYAPASATVALLVRISNSDKRFLYTQVAKWTVLIKQLPSSKEKWRMLSFPVGNADTPRRMSAFPKTTGKVRNKSILRTFSAGLGNADISQLRTFAVTYTGWVKSFVTCSGCCNAITALHVDVKFRVQTISTTANTMSQSYGCLYSRILDFWVSEGWFCWVSVAIG